MKFPLPSVNYKHLTLYSVFGCSLIAYFWLTKEFILWTLFQDDSDKIIQIYMYTIGFIWLLSALFNWIQLLKNRDHWMSGLIIALFPLVIIPLIIAVLWALKFSESLWG